MSHCRQAHQAGPTATATTENLISKSIINNLAIGMSTKRFISLMVIFMLPVVCVLSQQLDSDQYLVLADDQQTAFSDLLASVSDGGLLPGAHQRPQARQHQATHPAPGHYEFDVAPKMEPPSVRKPPYRQTAQVCPGSDLLGGFSPRDTLCGDLNQGKVPLNPLGQSITDQAYPFELIKNKTLQFLARALPVLKLEYETIPKVARYLPANQLLNPTSHQSPLGHEHLHDLNQRFASSLVANDFDIMAPPFLRRRKRSIRQQAGITVAEMSPNATLVVSSAHSAGKIQSKRSSTGQLDGSNGGHLMITKDGFRPIGGSAASAARTQVQAAGATGANYSSQQQLVAADDQKMAAVGGAQAPGGPAVRQQQPATGAGAQAPRAPPQDSRTGGGGAPPTTSRNHASPQAAHKAESRAEGNSDNNYGATANGQVHARSGGVQTEPVAGGGGGKRDGATNLSSSQRRRLSCAELGNAIATTVCQTAAALIEGDKPPAWVQVAKQIGNFYAGTSDNLSAWPLLGILGGSGQSADHTDAKSSAGAKSSASLWNYLGPLANLLAPTGAQKEPLATPANSGDNSHQTTPVSVQTKQDSRQQPATTNSFGQLNASTLARMALAGWATTALAGLVEYLVPSAFSSASRSFAKRKKPFEPGEMFIDTPASLAALSASNTLKQLSTSSAPIIGKQPPTPCPSVEEYISPTFARNYQGAWKYVVQIPHEGYFTQTIQRSSCVRQKCEFTEGVCHEAPRWVSLLVAEIYYPNAIFSAQSSQSPNLPTSEHQAAQSAGLNNGQQTSALLGQQMATAQSTSNLQQVALGHPHQVHQHQQHHHHQQQQQPKSVAQDPLQMTDSLSTYNHNLNAAFLNAANQLGLDPTNVAHMQQLADAHNYQLLSRNGLLQSGQAQPMVAAESHVSYSSAAPTAQYLDAAGAGGQQQSRAPTTTSSGYHQAQLQRQQTKQFNELAGAFSGQQAGNNYNEYIRALAAETLRQNPHLSVDDLIKSLQLQQNVRKKRDLSGSIQAQQGRQSNSVQYSNQMQLSQHQQQQQQQQQQVAAQPRSSSASIETIPSLNDLGSSLSAQQQQQHQQQQQQINKQLANEQQQPNSGTSQSGGAGGQISGLESAHSGPSAADPSAASNANQVECDGHDKIGCYVVRVYYDWFLVNGSCKCWRTNSGAGQQQSSQTGNSFLRRIFTG